uniref:Uncharacterized protein n=1 Tax=Octopus bimaculoides TaxID=37653 RepID=A0A0L8HVU5_OCTBM
MAYSKYSAQYHRFANALMQYQAMALMASGLN